MANDLIFQIALTQVPYIGHVHAKTLALHFGSAQAIFSAKRRDLECLEGIGERRAKSIKSFSAFRSAEKEIAFIDKYKIRPLFINSDEYPKRLLNCYDPPALLYYKGNADLNAKRIVSIVGTRNNSEYGKHLTEKLIKDISFQTVVIISGLAYGIDSIAHKTSLKNGIPTIGVLAHGLDSIYPPENTGMAKLMMLNGGLLTEFLSGTKPDKHHFPSRNRIVAGMSDATIVVETGIKGGSMITGELAHGYNRDVFAVPGRTTDHKSSGCNFLIKTNKASLINDVSDLIESLGWNDSVTKKRNSQKLLFIELNAEERIVYDLLNKHETASIDTLNLDSGLSNSQLCAALLSLELKNVVSSMPGKLYTISN